MKRIRLANGRGYALVDDEDYEELSKHKWYCRRWKGGRYAMRTVKSKGTKRNLRMHRILTGAVAGQVVDHKDGNGLNNQKANLRICTQRQNTYNSKKRSGNRYKGIYKDLERSLWAAEIKLPEGKIHLGRYETAREAATAYDIAATIVQGEFCQLNFPDADYSFYLEQAKTKGVRDVVREARQRTYRGRKKIRA